MKLASKVLKLFSIIFIGQILAMILVGAFLYSRSLRTNFPESIISSLTKFDKSIIDGVILQNSLNNILARDLVSYKLIELNGLDSVVFINDAQDIIDNLKSCQSINGSTLCKKKRNIAVSIVPLYLDKSVVGYLKLEKSLRSIVQDTTILFTVGYTLFLVFAINLLGLSIFWWRFLKPETDKLINVFTSQKRNQSITTSEFNKIQDEFLHSLDLMKDSETAKMDLELQLNNANLATQLAHDIRSPLEVLKTVKDELNLLPSSINYRLNLSIDRIEEISMNLLKSYKNPEKGSRTSEDLIFLMNEIIVEKAIEYKKCTNLSFESDFDKNLNFFSNIHLSDFKSVISNLINNAVEALSHTSNGIITVRILFDENFNYIHIVDNGMGISEEVSLSLFKKGFTTKSNGHGLGLHSSQKMIREMGGDLSYVSIIGNASTFVVSLPKGETPLCYTSSIDLTNIRRIIILDDDLTFHEVWKEKLRIVSIPIEHYYTVETFLTKYSSLEIDTLLLIDYQVMHEELDGIDVISRINHFQNSVLTTARAHEEIIRSRCEKSNIKLLHKIRVNSIPIILNSISSKLPIKVVQIDDDKLMGINWKSYCDKNNIILFHFFSIEDFIKVSSDFPKDTLIFIDSQLGNGSVGEVDSENIGKLGFNNLFLSTGFSSSFLSKPTWIKEIFSKDPNVIMKALSVRSLN